jgi:hypothetical protein
MKITPLQRERWYPWVIGTVCLVALMLSRHYSLLSLPTSENFHSATLSLGGVFTGFMATLNTLLFGLNDKTYGRLKISGYLHDMLIYLSEALWGSLALCVVSLLCFYVSWYFMEPLLAGVAAFTFSSIYRITRVATSLLAKRT